MEKTSVQNHGINNLLKRHLPHKILKIKSDLLNFEIKEKVIKILILVGIAFIFGGCVLAPVDTFETTRIKCKVISDSGKPVNGIKIEILQFGLEEIEENNFDETKKNHPPFFVSTDSNGEFECQLEEESHGGVFWLIPPLGKYPPNPLTPCILLRIPNEINEWWGLDFIDGKLRARTGIFNNGTIKFLSSSLVAPMSFKCILVWEDRKVVDCGYLMNLEIQLLQK